MAQLLVRNVEDGLKARLQRRAKRNGRSMEAEVREILQDVLREKEAPRDGMGTEIAKMFRGVGLKKGEEIEELRGLRIEAPKFER